MKNKFLKNILQIIFIFFIYTCIVIVVDPFFQYHKPNKYLKYNLNSIIGNTERYLNGGIIKQYSYNAVILGSSMTEKFKKSQFDNLFQVEAIKTPAAGATYYETRKLIENILNRNKKIKVIFRSIDLEYLNENKTKENNFTPQYLYDNKLWNDYMYIFDIKTFEQLIKILFNTLINNPQIINLDYYPKGSDIRGKKGELKRLMKLKNNKIIYNHRNLDLKELEENIEENLIKIAKKNPQIKFIYFIPPYSILYWNNLKRTDKLPEKILSIQILLSKLVEVKNIEVYSFCNDFETICNLDNYNDSLHYIGEINDKIIDEIYKGNYKITKENYNNHLKEIENYHNKVRITK
ncbi:hypothetical protein [Fusobacterium sp. HC1336]|uniref:hypothetical protein n=1 Tax=Fusobacterium sp. HC1336 TaxID=3171169 RepID=UPI003F1E9A0A